VQKTLHLQATVLPGHRIELSSPDLPEGSKVDVIVLMPAASPERRAILDYLDSLPAGPRSCSSWEEFERIFQQEKDSWDR
jgi:hypothetical protein